MGFELSLIVPLAIVIATYGLIAFDLMHRTVAALLGALLLVNLGYMAPEVALTKVNMDTILLLLGMMLILSVVEKVGFFELLTLRVLSLSGRSLWRLLVVLVVTTAILSAFLDNVTTVMLLCPVVLEITLLMDINPMPFLLAMAFASNIGGTATLIGDPPNIMIGTATDFSFMEFMVNLGPIVAINVVVLIGYIWFMFRDQIPNEEIGPECIRECRRRFRRRDTSKLNRCLIIFLITLVAFMFHEELHLKSYLVALSGGTALLLLTKIRPEQAMRDIEWSTLVFFAGLFVVVGALEEIGLSESLAGGLLQLTEVTRGQLQMGLSTESVLIPLIIGIGGALSGLLGAIPNTAVMIPVIESLHTGLGNDGLWWALSLGACFGGNATLIGTSANIVVAGLSEREGYPVSFRAFMKYGIPLTLITLTTSMIYVNLLFT